MKGLTHFTVGMMTATFFSYAVQAALIEKAWIILLGGIFGLLPDFLDFRIARYLEKFDIELMPDEKTLNAQVIADTIAWAIDRTWHSGKRMNVKLHTIKLGADMWRQYSVQFVPEEHKIKAWIGPIVSTSQLPIPGTEISGDRAYGEARFEAPLEHTYEKKVNVDIFSGPDFEFVKEDDRVVCNFISWHRRWSHSITLALVFAPLGFLLYGINSLGALASAMIFTAYVSHVLTDQLGVLGSNLFFPFTHKRSKGLGLFHSGNTMPNLFTNYIAITVIIWNLNAFGLKPVFTTPWYVYFPLVTVLPLVLAYIFAWVMAGGKFQKVSEGTAEAEEILAEAEEGGI